MVPTIFYVPEHAIFCENIRQRFTVLYTRSSAFFMRFFSLPWFSSFLCYVIFAICSLTLELHYDSKLRQRVTCFGRLADADMFSPSRCLPYDVSFHDKDSYVAADLSQIKRMDYPRVFRCFRKNCRMYVPMRQRGIYTAGRTFSSQVGIYRGLCCPEGHL